MDFLVSHWWIFWSYARNCSRSSSSEGAYQCLQYHMSHLGFIDISIDSPQDEGTDYAVLAELYRRCDWCNAYQQGEVVQLNPYNSNELFNVLIYPARPWRDSNCKTHHPYDQASTTAYRKIFNVELNALPSPNERFPANSWNLLSESQKFDHNFLSKMPFRGQSLPLFTRKIFM